MAKVQQIPGVLEQGGGVVEVGVQVAGAAR